MAPKSSTKAKKGSKLASIKKAIFGTGKAKAVSAKSPVKSAAKPTGKAPAAKAPVMAASKKPATPVKAAAKPVSKTPAPKTVGVAKPAALAKQITKTVAAPVMAAAIAPVKTAKPLRGKAALNFNKAGHAAAQALNSLKRSSGGMPSPIYSRGEGGDAVCRETACESLNTTGGYCRLHYIRNWKKIKRKELILKEKKLNSYIEELVVKYPDKYIEAIRQDLASDKDFAKVIYDLDLDENADDFEGDAESAEGLIDTIKRDFEDDGDGF